MEFLLRFCLVFELGFLWITLCNCVIGIQTIDPDILLRDMPMQDEPPVPCCTNGPELSKVPDATLAELSQMTNAEFAKQFGDSLPIEVEGPAVIIKAEAETFGPRIYKQEIDDGLQRSIGHGMVFTTQELLPMGMTIGQAMPPAYAIMSGVDHDSDSKPALGGGLRFGRLLDAGVEIVPMAENPLCSPKDTVVPLPQPSNHSLIIYPQCTLVKQCGGCCGHSGLECQPSEKRTIKRKASHLAFVSGRLRVVDNNVIVEFTEHVQCGCKCRQLASDCSANQTYDPNSCKCICKNKDKSNSCGPNRVWDADRCECKCPYTGSCPVGFSFDNSYYCACLPNPGTRQGKSAAKPVPAASVPSRQDSRWRSRSG